MRSTVKSVRHLIVFIGAALALSVPSTLAPSWAQEMESDQLLNSNETWLSCTVENSPCPESPAITSVTGEVDSVTVSWSWGEDRIIPADITQIVVRVEPVDVNSPGIEREIQISNTSARIEELSAGSNYTISVFGAAGVRLGVPSVVEEATLDEPSTGFPVVDAAMAKPRVTEGDVERLIVTLNDQSSAESQAKDISADLPVAGVEVEGTRSLGAGNALINLTNAVSDADAAIIIDDLSSDPRVKAVEVDERVRAAAFPSDPPDDPFWTSDDLWGLYGTYGIGIATSKTSMNPVWSTGQGSGTVVAVIDTGSTSHPDLDSQYVAGYDFVSGLTAVTSGTDGRSTATSSDGDYIDTATYGVLGWDSNPSDPGDWTNGANSSWHGTHVAGTIGAQTNNGIGVAGVAPLAQIQPIRALSFGGGWTSDIVAAVTWASGEAIPGVPTNTTPADVINLSLGGYSPTCSSTWQRAIDGAVALGAVVVVSAGNSSADASNYSPANCNNVITVAASTSAGVRASYSNYGSAVDITAPGSNIMSTMNSGTTVPSTPNYVTYNGTSMAAPHVAGVAALLKEFDSNITPSNVLSRMQSTVMTFPVTGSGYDCTTSVCGAGLLQASGLPTLTSLSATGGPVAGGVSITVSGSYLDSVTGVTFGGTAASLGSQTFNSLVVTTPAHSAGAVNLVLTNGSGSTTWSSAYTFYEPPTLSSIGTLTGSTAGGATVTLSGTNLSGATAVTFGGTSSSITSATSTSVDVITPAHAEGAVSVVITTPGGSASLASAFTYITPVSTPAPSGGGSSSSSSSSPSSTSSSASGSNGGLNEIVSIVPSAAGSPGTVIALAGWGLSTTRSVMFNEYEATWLLINDGHVEVTVPDIPTGVYVIHAVLAPTVGRASYWDGFFVSPPVASSTPVGPSPSSGSPSPTTGTGGITTRGDFVTFKGKSTVLTPATRTKMNRIVQAAGDASALTTVTTFSDLRGSQSSKKVAQIRAKKIAAYLRGQGLIGKIDINVDQGTVSRQSKGALVRMTTDLGQSLANNSDSVRSLVVRYSKGVSPLVDGKVVGSNRVTGSIGSGMSLGPNLGLRMYRIDFAQPVSAAAAQKAAVQMSQDKKIEFAEPDSLANSVDPFQNLL